MNAENAEALIRVARKYGFVLVANCENISVNQTRRNIVTALVNVNDVSETEANKIASSLADLAYPRAQWEGILNLSSSIENNSKESLCVVLTQHETWKNFRLR